MRSGAGSAVADTWLGATEWQHALPFWWLQLPFRLRGDAEMVAYVGGTQVTDHEQVMQQMLSAMRSVDINQTDTDVDQELQMMINTIK